MHKPIYITVKEKTLWNDTVYNVTDYGAVASDDIDDTYAIRLAVAAAGERGGVVYFPKGKYVLSNTLKIPEFVTLQGEGCYNTQLCYVTTYFDKGEIPDSFLRSTGNIAVKDLDFWSTRSRGFLYTDETCKGNIFLENLN